MQSITTYTGIAKATLELESVVDEAVAFNGTTCGHCGVRLSDGQSCAVAFAKEFCSENHAILHLANALWDESTSVEHQTNKLTPSQETEPEDSWERAVQRMKHDECIFCRAATEGTVLCRSCVPRCESNGKPRSLRR